MQLTPIELERQLAEKAEELKMARRKAAEARSLAQSLKKKAPLFLASLKNKLKLNYNDASEEAIKRMAEGNSEYNQVIIGLCAAETQANQLEADVEGLKDQWESIRSALSYEKSLIQERLYNRGR